MARKLYENSFEPQRPSFSSEREWCQIPNLSSEVLQQKLTEYKDGAEFYSNEVISNLSFIEVEFSSNTSPQLNEVIFKMKDLTNYILDCYQQMEIEGCTNPSLEFLVDRIISSHKSVSASFRSLDKVYRDNLKIIIPLQGNLIKSERRMLLYKKALAEIIKRSNE